MQGQPSDSQPLDVGAAIGAGREAEELDGGNQRQRSTRTEGTILGLLLGDDHHGVWSREEIERTVSADSLSTNDAIDELVAAGLVHELEHFIFASQAARSFDRLDV